MIFALLAIVHTSQPGSEPARGSKALRIVTGFIDIVAGVVWSGAWLVALPWGLGYILNCCSPYSDAPWEYVTWPLLAIVGMVLLAMLAVVAFRSGTLLLAGTLPRSPRLAWLNGILAVVLTVFGIGVIVLVMRGSAAVWLGVAWPVTTAAYALNAFYLRPSSVAEVQAPG